MDLTYFDAFESARRQFKTDGKVREVHADMDGRYRIELQGVQPSIGFRVVGTVGEAACMPVQCWRQQVRKMNSKV